MRRGINPALWESLVDRLRVDYPDLARGWFADLRPADLENGVLDVLAENQAQVDYLNQRCRRAFSAAAQAVFDRLIAVRFDHDGLPDVQSRAAFDNDPPALQTCPDYSFENFITGPSNRFAHAASIAVAENPGRAYNPLFIQGDVGLGKTHLLQAILQACRSRKPTANALYLSCEMFANHFLETIEHGNLEKFRYRYRHVDMLMIDDIQFLGERERSQEEFFHTFNTLYQSQRQIVLSADCAPNEIPSLEKRLVSRFNSGLVACVERPCLETRMAIVRAKAKLRCIDVPEDVVKLIATRIDSNVRDLEGALSAIDLCSQTHSGKINLPVALEALRLEPTRPTVSISDILAAISKRYAVRVSDLQGKRRTRSIVSPRQICMYLARELTALSLEEIGGYFGGRDHTTVLHAYRLIAAKRSSDSRLDSELGELAAGLKSGFFHN